MPDIKHPSAIIQNAVPKCRGSIKGKPDVQTIRVVISVIIIAKIA